MEHKVDEPVAVAPLVVVPGHDLDEGGVEHDAGVGVEHGRTRVVHEVLADNVLWCPNTLVTWVGGVGGGERERFNPVKPLSGYADVDQYPG